MVDSVNSKVNKITAENASEKVDQANALLARKNAKTGQFDGKTYYKAVKTGKKNQVKIQLIRVVSESED